jgi:uncharacterized protein with NRDE domain
MCIAIISTAHLKYKLILIDNRDEFVNRPTSNASWWPEHPDVYGSRDLLRPAQGTWLGVTKTGKIAVLTNYKEAYVDPRAVSRGEIIKKFLTEDVGSTEDFVSSIVDSGVARDAGGFSLVCGKIGEKLAIVSNRAEPGVPVPWIVGAAGETIGLSNAAFEDRSWKKVLMAEGMVREAIVQSQRAHESEDVFIQRLLKILSLDTLPRQGDLAEGGLSTYGLDLRNTILVPPLGRQNRSTLDGDKLRSANDPEKVVIMDERSNGDTQQLGVDGIYATQKQSVVLVDHKDNVRFFERTLWNQKSERIEVGKGDIDTSFSLSTR